MSHFTVSVIHEKNDNLERVLEPFNENVEPNGEYALFEDREEEMKKEYETSSREMYESPDGMLYLPFDDIFKNPAWTFSSSKEVERYIRPDDYVKKEVLFSKIYNTFDDFVKEYHGYSSRDSVQKKYGYWSNPNAKWDWYVVGGRWGGLLKLKDGCRPALLGNNDTPVIKDNYCDSARLGDIDFEGMKTDLQQKYSELWEEMKLKEKRDALTKHDKVWHYGVREDETKEQYVERNSNFHTYSILVDGEWMEAGEMGWFGASSATEEKKKEWDESFMDIINKLVEERPDSILTLVDCHI